MTDSQQPAAPPTRNDAVDVINAVFFDTPGWQEAVASAAGEHDEELREYDAARAAQCRAWGTVSILDYAAAILAGQSDDVVSGQTYAALAERLRAVVNDLNAGRLLLTTGGPG
jgi:hypothetical protein